MPAQETGVPSLFVISLMQFLVGALLLIALLNGQRDLIILTLLVLGVMVGSRLWAQKSLVGLQHRFRIDKLKAFPGETLTLKVTIENAKLLPIWLHLNLPVRVAELPGKDDRMMGSTVPPTDLPTGRQGGTGFPADLPDNIPVKGLVLSSSGETPLMKEGSLLWYQRMHFDWSLVADRRGVYEVGPLYLEAGDLFAFSSKQKRAEESRSVIVYPKLVSLRFFPLPRLDFFGVPKAKHPIQDPIYILGTRDYQHGQPARYIHWKATARHHRLQEKVFESTHQEKILLIVDVGSFERRQAEEDFERVLEVVASLAVRLDEQGHALGLIANGSLVGGGSPVVPVAKNDQQMSAILELLARLQLKQDREMQEVLGHQLTFSWGASCIYFSCEENETVHSVKKYLHQRRIPAMFFVCQRHVPVERGRFDVHQNIYPLDEIRQRAST